jgi:hypothetical protein
MDFKFRQITCFLYIATVLVGCRCKDERLVPPIIKEQSFLTYWPIDSSKKWIFEVKKEVNSNLVYVYDDTLEFIKDSNILINGELIFYEFRFKKSYFEDNYIIGNYPDNIGKLYLYMDRVNYTLFDVNTFTDNSPGKTYKSNGLPIDTRYEMNFVNLTGVLNTNIGKLKCVNSYYTFLHKYNIGQISRNVAFTFSEGNGPVRIDHFYEHKGIPNVKDSSNHLIYEIKEIIKE